MTLYPESVFTSQLDRGALPNTLSFSKFECAALMVMPHEVWAGWPDPTGNL